MYVHLVARLSLGLTLSDTQAAWLWAALRRFAPHALAVVLMPDHFHLIVAVGDPARARRRLSRTLQAYSRRFGGGWTTPDDVRVIPDRAQLRRQVRYVALNPCRRGLVDDPLRWLWSTHRDVVGAVCDPWVSAERLAASLGEWTRGFADRHHSYVSGDPSVTVRGTPPPRLIEVADAAPTTILAAAEAALRHVPGGRRAARRRAVLFVALGRACRFAVDDLRRLVPIGRTTAYRRSSAVAPDDLRAARMCLGDPRLLHPRRLGPGSMERKSRGRSLGDPRHA